MPKLLIPLLCLVFSLSPAARVFAIEELRQAAQADTAEEPRPAVPPAEAPRSPSPVNELKREYPDLARADEAYNAEEPAFLALFRGPARDRAQEFLRRAFEYDRRESYRAQTGETPKEKNRAMRYMIERRLLLARYMRAVREADPQSRTWPALLRPVLFAPYNPEQRDIQAALAAHAVGYAPPALERTGETTVRLRNVNGTREVWRFVPNTRRDKLGMMENGLTYAYCEPCLLPPAMVALVRDGRIESFPVAAPTLAEVYPTTDPYDSYAGWSPLLDTRQQLPQAKNTYVRPCVMGTFAQADTEAFPFRIVTGLRQIPPSEGNLAYLCLAEKNIIHEWNGEGFAPVRAEDAGPWWGARSPFKGNVLFPVEEKYAELVRTNPRLAAHHQEYNAVWRKFQAILGPNLRKAVLADHRQWRLRRPCALFALLDDDTAFVTTWIESESPMLEYMRRVLQLAETPDSRLLFLIQAATNTSRFDLDSRESRAYRWEEDPYIFSLQGAMSLLREGDEDFTEPGAAVVLTQDNRELRVSLPHHNDRYITCPQPGGSIRGTVELLAYDRYEETTGTFIYRLDKGRVELSAPPTSNTRTFRDDP